MWEASKAYQNSAKKWSMTAPVKTSEDFQALLGPYMAMVREFQVDHSIWADTIVNFGNRMQKGLKQSEVDRQKVLAGVTAQKGTLEDQLARTRKELAMSERSACRQDEKVADLTEKLSVATSNREEELSSMTEQLKAAVEEREFSELARFRALRELDAERESAAGLREALGKEVPVSKAAYEQDQAELRVLRAEKLAWSRKDSVDMGVQVGTSENIPDPDFYSHEYLV
jgi:hypothetical protein